MVPNSPADSPSTAGVIADNIIGFGRALRAAGLPVGPGAIIDAMNALQIVGKYALSAKVSVNATVRTLERSLANSLVNPPSGHDRTTYAILGARWTPLRSVEVGCNVSRERRTSDVLALSQPYSSNSFGCYGQLTLQ